MTTLRITQTTESTGKYRVELSLDGDSSAPQSASASFPFEVSPQDQEDLRWYLEDYLQFPHDPAPTIAARIEQRMTEIGTELFNAVFDSSTQATRLWAKIYERASDLRVEIVTSVREAAAIPWELLRDPHTDTVLALRAAAFVRTHREAAVTPKPLDATSGPIRILLVICRPKLGDDVPFRSVASRLVKALTEDARAVFQLDVLRPPTYDQFAKTLRQAKRDGKPYHVVHFDGHGMYAGLSENDGGEAASAWLASLIPLMLSGPREGSHGYLLFENPANEQNLQLVDGDAFGKLLYETNTPILVVNACRSAHADVAEQPEHANSSDVMHAQVRAFGSLAQEVIDAGVTGVVAMRYNVYVVTAAQFVADLYAALVQGNTLGEAVTLGRKQLRDNPNRTIAFAPRPLQDWCVPLVYEAMPTALFPKPDHTVPPKITVSAGSVAVVERSERPDSDQLGVRSAQPQPPTTGSQNIDARLLRPPDVGFFGRDETLLALDRAFDGESIVLLHAYAGSGKTATAAEFARWYSLTGGVDGPVLFTSFEQHQPLARVLDRVGEVFGSVLEQSGVNWLALDDGDRRDVALQVLKKIPLLWIWDNVEPVSGFPAGTKSAWSDDEQQELVNFLRDAARTKAKFLLTSRRDEREWLGDNLPCRIPVPPMPMQERVQLALAIAQRQRRKLADVDDWRPLLRFTAGNPLTITVLVGQALRDGLTTRDQIEAFVEKLRIGEAAFDDDASEGRDRSLAASLNYGFEHAFDEDERRQLALLRFFQGFIDVHALQIMGGDKAVVPDEHEWFLPALRGITRESAFTLLNRASEIGLLTSLGAGFYDIHPVLSWFFRRLSDQLRAAQQQECDASSDHDSSDEIRDARAFVEAMGALANNFFWQYERGNRNAVTFLWAQEHNLLYALCLAQSQKWWRLVVSMMQGLDVLYEQTGRIGEWRRLVQEVVSDFLDPVTSMALPGREDEWNIVIGYRARLARQAKNWKEAAHLYELLVDNARERAAPSVEDGSSLIDREENPTRTLAVSLHELGEMYLDRQQSKCVSNFEEALDLSVKIGDRQGSARCAYNLGRAFESIGNIRDFGRAEQFYQQSLDLTDERDPLGKATCLAQLGSVSQRRFEHAQREGSSNDELREYVDAALAFYSRALDVTPDDALHLQAVIHHQVGFIKGHIVRATEDSMRHFRIAIKLHERVGNLYDAAQSRACAAGSLANSGRFVDAREYALAALRNYQTCGDAATAEIEDTEKLISKIENAMAGE